MRSYDVAEIVADGETNPVGGPAIFQVMAESGRDALAEYSLSQGFSDPRESDEEYESWFTYWPEAPDEDVWTMVFTNTELIAVPSDRRDVA